MKVYRVYENFYGSNKVGTYEYGTFSDKKAAVKRVQETWKWKKYPMENIEVSEDGGWYSFDETTRIAYCIMIHPMYMGKRINQQTIQMILPPSERYPGQ